jgi:predicted nucleic acid-binding protein/tetratricopeptide (TPR) repeat protein
VVFGEDAQQVRELLDEAEAVDANYPLLIGLRHALAERWQAAEDALALWNPVSAWERDAHANLRGVVLARSGRLDQAIAVLQGAGVQARAAGVLILLAKLLLERAARGSGDSRWADALGAIETALHARNQRRTWRGDSAEAVVVAAEAALAADDPQQAWSITRPSPQGDATEQEAADGRVMLTAAVAAALTGRTDQARELAAETDNAYQRARIEAELASAELGGQAAIAAWRRVYRACTSDDQKLHALDQLAKEGFLDHEALDALRAQYPEAVGDIELDHAVMSATGPDADEQLRAWEARSPLASVRRAQLARTDDPRKAAEILSDATARHNDPRLLRLAIDCYTEAGEWKLAEELAEQTLADGGTLWPGRADVLRRLLLITWALREWTKVASTSRNLLEIDADDDDARWALAIAQVHTGELEQAWHTLGRAGTVVRAATPGRCQYLLELTRRFADAKQVARTALEAIKVFPDDHDVQAAALNALTLGPDLSGLAEEVGGEITAAWSSFFERYPDSRYFSAFALREGENPLADIEEMMRAHARGYEEILATIRDQQFPLGALKRYSGKPYAATFLYRPLGYHPAGSSAPSDIDYELAVAREARDHTVLVDASALYTLALLPQYATALIALTHRPALIDAAFMDLIASDDHFNTPSNWTMDFDHTRDRVVVTEHPQETIDRQRALIRAMLETARTLRRVAHPALVHLASPDPERDSPWNLTLDAAKESGAIVWTDDIGLRRLAHGEGIKAFGTLSLLTLARERGRIDETAANEITRTLISEYVVDLPFDLAALEAVAAAGNWAPSGPATVLGRAHTWNSHLGAAESLLHHALLHASEAHLAQWSYAAMAGLTAAAPADQDGNIAALVCRFLCDRRSRPEHAEALAAAVTAFVPDRATSIMRSALDNTWRDLRRNHGRDAGAIVFRHLISRLDENHRAHGADLIAASAV